MAKNILQLNYDELSTIAKKFKDEGEDTLNLYTSTRQRVRDLHKEWIGDAADKFFDEMETELLPALQRVAKALHFSQDVTNDIMRIVHEADEDTTNFFKNDFSRDDFGASLFQGALGGVPGGQSGPDDFGAGKFGDALNGLSGDGSPGGGSSGPDDFGASKFEEALPGQGSGDTAGGGGDGGQGGSSESDSGGGEEAATTETAAGGGGGGGSSSPSQGLKGDLKNMGIGTGQVQQNASSGGPNTGSMSDHIYSGGGSLGGDGGTPTPPPGPDTTSNEQSSSSEGGGAAAAGAAGAAAAGGAAKGIKSKKKKNK